MEELYVAEYSSKGKNFHVSTASRMIEQNLRTIARQDKATEPGYICFGIFKTANEAHNACTAIRERLRLKTLEERFFEDTESEAI